VDPALTLFWMTLAVQLGTFVAFVMPDRRIVPGLAVLASFLSIGLSLGVPLGNPWAPVLIAWALTGGLSWEWLVDYVRYRMQVKTFVLMMREGNHERWSLPLRSVWRERLARWGFPSQAQMELQHRRCSTLSHHINGVRMGGLAKLVVRL